MIRGPSRIGPLEKRIGAATDGAFIRDVDWGQFLVITDEVSGLHASLLPDVVDAVRRLLAKRGGDAISLGLLISLLEALSKNCGMKFLRALGANEDMMTQLHKLAHTTSARRSQAEILLHTKILDLVQAWGEQFLTLKSSEPSLTAFVALYHTLRCEHMQFGLQLDEHRPPVLTPPPFIPAPVASPVGRGGGRGGTGAPPEEIVDGLSLLRDALEAAGGDAARLRQDEIASDAAANLKAALPQLSVHIEAALTSGGEDVGPLLELHDGITKLLGEYGAVLSKKAGAKGKPAATAATARAPAASPHSSRSGGGGVGSHSHGVTETDLMAFLSAPAVPAAASPVPAALAAAAAPPAPGGGGTAKKTPFLPPPRSYTAPTAGGGGGPLFAPPTAVAPRSAASPAPHASAHPSPSPEGKASPPQLAAAAAVVPSRGSPPPALSSSLTSSTVGGGGDLADLFGGASLRPAPAATPPKAASPAAALPAVDDEDDIFAAFGAGAAATVIAAAPAAAFHAAPPAAPTNAAPARSLAPDSALDDFFSGGGGSPAPVAKAAGNAHHAGVPLPGAASVANSTITHHAVGAVAPFSISSSGGGSVQATAAAVKPRLLAPPRK